MDTTESRSFAARLADLLKNEQHAMADFLVALAEFDRQRAWLALGYSGLFPFLHQKLGLSKSASFFRKTAAELIQRYPEIVEPLRDGRLCLSTMASVAKVLTPANRAEVLPRFFHRSALEAKTIVAEFAPVPNPPTRTVVTVTPVRELPPAPAQMAVTDGARGSHAEPGPDESTNDRIDQVILQPSPSLRVEPLTPTVTRIHVSVSPAFVTKLEDARLALSRSMPGADAEAILSAGLDLLLARDAKKRGLVEKPRSTLDDAEDAPDSDHVPAAVEREVRKRDGDCCQWQLESGGICGSRFQIQLDHIIPLALGGKSVLKNLRLLCAPHNKWAARQKLGHALMNRYCKDPRQPLLAGLPRDGSGG